MGQLEQDYLCAYSQNQRELKKNSRRLKYCVLCYGQTRQQAQALLIESVSQKKKIKNVKLKIKENESRVSHMNTKQQSLGLA